MYKERKRESVEGRGERENEDRSIKCNKYNYNEGGEEEDAFFPARAENAEFIIKRERTDGSDRKTSEIIINLANDDKNRAERNYCRRGSAFSIGLKQIGRHSNYRDSRSHEINK